MFKLNKKYYSLVKVICKRPKIFSKHQKWVWSISCRIRTKRIAFFSSKTSKTIIYSRKYNLIDKKFIKNYSLLRIWKLHLSWWRPFRWTRGASSEICSSEFENHSNHKVNWNLVVSWSWDMSINSLQNSPLFETCNHVLNHFSDWRQFSVVDFLLFTPFLIRFLLDRSVPFDEWLIFWRLFKLNVNPESPIIAYSLLTNCSRKFSLLKLCWS